MKKKVMQKWVRALRSGEFKQGRGYLCVGEEYCCLGVLCELAMLEGVVEVKSSGLGSEVYTYGEFGDIGTLPREVKEWSGIKTAIGWAKGTTLTVLNDERRWTFDEIADFIEANYKEL